jgi:DNA helicase-2/ATP-dependent DNA helicase PcrA
MARLLAEDVQEPRGVACITYNNECARELENRLDALGIQPGGRVFIGTVHSFSLTQIVLPYAKVAGLGLPEEFSVATKQERAIALENAYLSTIDGPENPQNWDFRMGNYRRSILDRNSSEWRSRDPEVAMLVEAYEKELRKMGQIDFDDMPLLAVRALRENEWLKKAVLAKYPVLVVDEYQDLGRALHLIVMGLCFSAGMRLFAVGDMDQSIYGFTGAHPELLQRLSERKDVETVRLRLNYRCGSKIVTASSYALGEDRDYEAADGAAEGTIYFHPCKGDYEQQAEYLFSAALPGAMALIPKTRMGNIAILYPAAWIGDFVAAAAQYHKFPTIRTDNKAIYPRSSQIMRWLELCAQWCCGGWKTGSTRFSRVVGEGWRLFAEVLNTPETQLSFQRRLTTFLWERRNRTIPLGRWLTEFQTMLIDELIGKCRTLHDEREVQIGFVERICPGGDCEYMDLGQFAGQGEGSDCINLSTLHSSKGREFSIVVMFAMDYGKIPRKNPGKRQLIESRRLFYVGFTRAKDELHLMYSTGSCSPFVQEVEKRLEC